MEHVAGCNYHRDCILNQFSSLGTLSYTRNIVEIEMSEKGTDI